MKFTMTKIAAGLVLAAAATGAQAVTITSMTIEEIGSSNVGTSAAGTGGGVFYFGAEAGNGSIPTGGKTFVSAGSTDGAIIMGSVQDVGAFSNGFLYGGGPLTFKPDTNFGAPTADTNGTVDMSGWGGVWSATAKDYTLGPDAAGALVSSFQAIDATHYYYTMDWSHTITAAEDADFATQRADWHLEGVATVAAVPEASTYGMMLAGLGLVGFAVRRRKLMA